MYFHMIEKLKNKQKKVITNTYHIILKEFSTGNGFIKMIISSRKVLWGLTVVLVVIPHLGSAVFLCLKKKPRTRPLKKKFFSLNIISIKFSVNHAMTWSVYLTLPGVFWTGAPIWRSISTLLLSQFLLSTFKVQSGIFGSWFGFLHQMIDKGLFHTIFWRTKFNFLYRK